MADIVVDTRWIGPHGIGRFAAEVVKRLLALAGIDEPDRGRFYENITASYWFAAYPYSKGYAGANAGF